MIENGSLWIDTKNSKSYLREIDNWEDGSPQQQRSRKRSFENNSKILNDLEKKLLVFKKILRGYQQ